MRANPITGEIHKLEPEYITMSLKPGIGKSFYDKYETDFFPRDECPVPGKGVYNRVPKYYEQIYAKRNPNAHEKIKRAREEYRNTHSDEYTARRLATKEIVKEAQLKQLPRK